MNPSHRKPVVRNVRTGSQPTEPQTSDLAPNGRANWHTHTFRCKHASGEVMDYAANAVAGGLATLGMSDHCPLPEDAWPDYRMAMAELDGYIAAIQAARTAFPGLAIPMGLECDWSPDWDGWLRHLPERGFDYLLVGCHATPWRGGWIDSFSDLTDAARLQAYAAYVVTVMETGLFAAVTHPDVFGACADAWTPAHAQAARTIARASKATGVALELNGYGLRKARRGDRQPYPWQPFWDICAEEQVPVIVSSDAHRPEDTVAGLAELHARREALGLKDVDLLAC